MGNVDPPIFKHPDGSPTLSLLWLAAYPLIALDTCLTNEVECSTPGGFEAINTKLNKVSQGLLKLENAFELINTSFLSSLKQPNITTEDIPHLEF